MKKYLENISQTFFLRNAYFGALLLILFYYFSPLYFFYAFSASLIGYAYTRLYTTPKLLKDSGLITINGFFLGIAMASLFKNSPATQLCLLLGALSIPLVTKAVYETLQHWKLSPYVLPYILSTWTLWTSSHGQNRVMNIQLRHDVWPEIISTLPVQNLNWFNHESFIQVFLNSIAQSTGRLLFLPDSAFGLCILVLVMAFNLRKGFYLVAGTLLGSLLAFMLSSGYAWEYGFYSYSAGLVGLGLSARPERFNFLTIMLFCSISCILTLSIDFFFRNLGGTNSMALPLLSLPYMLTLWMAILSRSPRVNISWAPTHTTTPSTPNLERAI